MCLLYMPRRKARKTYRKKSYPKRANAYRMAETNLSRPMKTPRVNTQFTCVLPFQFQYLLDWKTGQDTSLSLLFSLDQCQGYQDFQNIFDFYRIDAVYLKVTPRFYTQQVNTQLQQQGQIGMYAYAIDRDDNAAATYDGIKARSGSRYTTLLTKRSIAFTPNRVNIIENVNQATTGRTVDTNYYNFVDLRQPRIPHFGLKMANNGSEIQAGTGLDGEYALNIDIRCKITFKGVGN